MRRACQNVCHKCLAIWVCILLCLSGVPTAPAWAEDPEEPMTTPAIEPKEASPDMQGSSEEGPVEPADAVTTYMSGTLSRECKTDDGFTYNVTVSFDESACVPEGAELRVELPVAGDDAARDNVQSRVERALALQNDDRILTTDYLVVSIEAGGHVVSPASAVNVEVQTDAIEPSRSAFVEVVVMGAGEDAEGGGQDETDAFAPADDTELPSDDRVIPQNVTDDEEDARITKLSFPARSLGTIALASVATRQDMWLGEGLAMSLLAPRQGLAVSITDEAAPELEKGMDCLACYAIQAEPRPAYGTSLWLEALTFEEVVQQENEQPDGVLVYLFDDEGGICGEPLCGPEGLSEPMELSASSKLLLVRDSGYRITTLDLAGVTVEGMMPGGTRGTAHEVTQDYAKPEALMVGLDMESARAVEEGTLEVAPLAAYDISLEADGKEYQPDEDHPLTVTITNNAIDDAVAAGKNVQVWHIAEDGTVEVIEDFTYAEGSIMFRASGFSTYLLVTQSETSVAPASFYVIDTRNAPVGGAEFALYTDAECSTPLVYMNAEVKATSNEQGLVSFGEILQGTYYMKETVTPEGYKKLTNIYTVVVDGTTPIASVVHSVDDGDTIIPDVEEMKPTKGSDNGAIKSANDSVSLEVSLDVDGDYADKTRAFEFELAVPEGSQLVGTIGRWRAGRPYEWCHVYTCGRTNHTLHERSRYGHPDANKGRAVCTTQAAANTPETVTVSTTDGEKVVMTLSGISGTSDNPAKVTITNTLENTNVPATGIGDNTIVWVAIIAGSVFLMALVWRTRRFEH